MIYARELATIYVRIVTIINIRYLPITKERTQHGIIHSLERTNAMTETVIIFICGMFAGILMEFVISAVVIMKGDK